MFLLLPPAHCLSACVSAVVVAVESVAAGRLACQHVNVTKGLVDCKGVGIEAGIEAGTEAGTVIVDS